MAKQKSRKSRVSNGGRQKAKVNQETKRQAYFARRRDAGKAYKYEPISAKPGTPEYYREKAKRERKASSSRDEISIVRSVMQKLENSLNKAKEDAKKVSEKNSKPAKKTA